MRGAYLAEIMRAGLLRGSVSEEGPVGRRRQPRRIKATIFRRDYLPRAMRVIVPPIGNETFSMLKTTSLVSGDPFTLERAFIARQRGQATLPRASLIAAASGTW